MFLNSASFCDIINMYLRGGDPNTHGETNMMRPLNAMPYAQAKVYIEGNNVTLVSYSTTVARIEDGFLTVYGLYSRTTIRHISAFVREFIPNADYYTAKKCYTDCMVYRIADGKFFQL